jgi:pantoate--beta-alanine ligase
MRVIRSIDEMRRACKGLHLSSPHQMLGLVPTMGALHQGHLSLVRTAKKNCGPVAASIFVNPTQFAPNEDYEQYPRSFQHDSDLLEREGVDLLFAPTAQEMYPAGEEAWVDVPNIGDRLDGLSRPGHFRAVATVVAKLFNIIRPDKAFFGQKDAAQVAVLRTMVRSLNFGVELEVCPTVRDEDGLALSSRNRYLSSQERREALSLVQTLRHVEQAATQGECSAPRLREILIENLPTSNNFRLDYAEIVDPHTLAPVSWVGEGALVAIAAWVGRTRLIDNVVIPQRRERTQ